MSKTTSTSSGEASRGLIRLIFLTGLIIFISAGWLWWQKVVNDPSNVFYGMLNNSMRTTSVGRRTEQSGGVQELSQRMQLQSGGKNIASSFTELSQRDGSESSVITESVGTPGEDYVRYVDIQTDQLNAKGEEFDFSSILGVWGKTEAVSSTSGELFGEATLGVVPFGYMPAAERAELMKFIRDNNVYEVDFKNAKREVIDGRPQYSYEVEVRTEKYVEMLKRFARSVGLTQLEAFDPASFRESPNLQFYMQVDILSRQLTRIVFADSGRTETYGSYGAKLPATVPDESIPVEELQLRLQTLQ